MRDTAVGGLATLLSWPSWRDSDAGPSIASQVSAAAHDENPVVRMRAAEAAWAMYAGLSAVNRVAAIGELLLAEVSTAVRTMLVHQLARDVAEAPESVDTILRHLIDLDNGCIDAGSDDSRRVIFCLLTYLALIPKAPFASQTIERWCQNAPAHSADVETFAQCARDYLAPSGSNGQQRAYQLLSVAAASSAVRWARDPQEHLGGAPLSKEQIAERQGAVKVTYGIAQQIYFASGAFDEEQGHFPDKPKDLGTFANFAFPLLQTCAGLGVAQCVHEAVQTMIFLAPLNEARALQAIAKAVPTDGLYAADSLAGSDVIPYLVRLLAEQRPLILFDEDGVTAFRHLLAAFAAAGNQDALEMAYTFADVFR